MPIYWTIPMNELSFTIRETATRGPIARLFPSSNLFQFKMWRLLHKYFLSVLPNKLICDPDLSIFSAFLRLLSTNMGYIRKFGPLNISYD